MCVYPYRPRHEGVTGNPGQDTGPDQQSELAETNVCLMGLVDNCLELISADIAHQCSCERLDLGGYGDEHRIGW